MASLPSIFISMSTSFRYQFTNEVAKYPRTTDTPMASRKVPKSTYGSFRFTIQLLPTSMTKVESHAAAP